MPNNSMTLTVAATGKAASTTSLQDVQNAVVRALRDQGVTLTKDDVKIEGRLS